MKNKILILLNHLFQTEEFRFLSSIKYSALFPYQNYIGVNFDSKDIVSIKLYFTFFEVPSDEIIQQFIPDTETFNKYISFFEITNKRTIENNGFTLSLKINSKQEITKGYHFRVNKHTQGIPLIKSFKVDLDDILNVGICQEFKTKTINKYYYYFNKPINKQKFSIRFNKPHFIVSDVLEYTESEEYNKIISCNISNNEFYNTFLKFNSPIINEIDSLFKTEFELDDKIAHGFYEKSDIEAKYYFKSKPTNQSNPIDSIENYHIDTISFILNKLK